jgi:tyrosyl-tRNA synthetase
MKKNTPDAGRVVEILSRGVQQVFPNADFFETQLQKGEPLTFYLGIDPTGPTLHLGHAIPLFKLRQLQDAGHHVVLLMGDFTAMIGDPTDKSAVRQQLSRDQVMSNLVDYEKQAGKILDMSKVAVKFNSSWLSSMNLGDALTLASEVTVQRMLERDMFEKRMQEGKPIYLHEFMYPLLQGYDSVAMDVDGEVGGNDQTFNMLVGRDLLKSLKHKEKVVIAMKLLTDSIGKKMGKTEGNMVSLQDNAEEMFGKIMSWSDDMIIPAFELITTTPMEEVARFAQAMKDGANPRDSKVALARAVVTQFHNAAAADAAVAHFEKVFSNKERPDDIPVVKVTSKTIVDVLVESKLAPSKGEAKRLVEQGGVKINDTVVTEMTAAVKKGDVIQKGKRFFIQVG